METTRRTRPGRRAGTVRRSHAERSAATRRRIIESAIRVLQQRGYDRISLQDIARGARVTLGAVQHQFGTRDALLEAVIDEVFGRLSPQSSIWAGLPEPLPQRAREFVRRAWDAIYGLPLYIAAWNLFFGCRSSGPLFARLDAKRGEDAPLLDRSFLEHFPEIRARQAKPKAFADLFWSSLRGIALLRLFQVPDEFLLDQLEALANTVVEAGGAATVRPTDRR